MRKWTTAILISSGLGVAGGCIIPKSDCEWDNTCNGSSSGGTDSGSDVKPDITPPGCDPTKDPKDNLECVVNSFGVFIDGAGGNDQNDGSKEKPVKTFKTALSKLGNKSRLYVCAGTYDERVELTSAISIYGGFACGAWTYAASNKVSIAPKEAGIALTLKNGGSEAAAFQDIEVKAAAGAAPGGSSIGMFVAQSTARIARSAIRAGEGADGATVPVATFDFTGFAPQDGKIPLGVDPNKGGLGGKVTCPGGAVSEGGKGGENGPGLYDGKAGSPGSATPGTGAAGTCTAGAEGATAVAVSDATPPNEAGSVTEAGWVGRGGTPGLTGNPGGGGGGGGARSAGGGGGGGSGACGGAGGGAGTGGGSSIGLVSSSATVALFDSVIASADAKAGGAGAGGQEGDPRFGQASAVITIACNGGRGTPGGKGGAGSGGAGGLSVGVLYKGTAPKLEGTTDANITIGAPGGKGPGGGAGNDGPKGRAAKVLATEPDGTVKPE